MNPYIKIFTLVVIIIICFVIQSYAVDLINTHDDLISALGLVLTVAVILTTIWGIKKVITTKTKNKNGKS